MAPLVLAPGENLINNRNIDPDSYQAYLRAKALIRGRGFKPMTDGAALLEQVVTRNPDYAPAWALLSEAYALSPLFHPAWTSDSQPELKRMIDAGIRRAEAAAERAVKLDSKNPDAYVSLANIRRARGELVEAEELYRKALQIDGDNSDVIHQYSELLAEVGRGTEAARMRQRLRVLDPFVPIYNYVTSMFLNANGNREDALGLANDLPATFPYRPFIQAQIYASQGRFGEAADLVARLPPEFIYPAVPQKAAKLLRIAPHRAPSVETLPRLGMLSFVYLYAGAPERSLELAEDDAEFGYSMGGYIGTLWDSAYADVRKTERFKIYAQHAGLVDYWRARGWPPQCHPTTGDDFECN
jgi:tetratricopeptide (TPR) repeat protein